MIDNKPKKDVDKECTCDEYQETDICPYSEEIDNIIVECSCCPYCRRNCADDI